ncbi:MAG: nitronate monooxygenase, partial [Nitrospirales bacterium]
MGKSPVTYPVVIQGGMGAGVSGWLLANAVSKLGQLGVVSGTALDLILSRRLQLGDPGGHMRRALNNFPIPEMAQRVTEKYFIPGGKKSTDAFKGIQMFSMNPSVALQELNVVANFVEVFLAKEGHNGKVGINYLEKIQLPNLPSIYGAMLAGVDYVLMGAGIPREIPGILDKLANHKNVSMMINVSGATRDDNFKVTFYPEKIFGKVLDSLKRPRFLAIIASSVLAVTLARKSTGKVDGFIIEGPTAGGHNASPRGELKLNKKGEPIYGAKDEVDLSKIKGLGLPFWLAGSFGTSEKFKEALELGAAGVQVGTAFAFCKESGLSEDIKESIIKKVLNNEAEVYTDPKASPTGFPFKIVKLEGSNSEKEVYEARQRGCDLGYLRQVYKKEDGSLGY